MEYYNDRDRNQEVFSSKTISGEHVTKIWWNIPEYTPISYKQIKI